MCKLYNHVLSVQSRVIRIKKIYNLNFKEYDERK